jgi:glutaredoxin-like protein
MAFLKDKDRKALTQEFETLTQPVKLILFTQALDCEMCGDTEKLLQEVAALSDKITLEISNIVLDKERAQQFGVDKTPAIVVMNGKDYGIRNYGIPAGYEFATLIQDIRMVSEGESGLQAETKAALQKISKPLHFQVFVTPTCPYCPRAVLTAHKMAMENEWIRADMIEATEFPELADKYGVMGVPRVVINDEHYFEGALPEQVFLLAALNALGEDTSELEKQLEHAHEHV